MSKEKSYLRILKESLKKKIELLKKIIIRNEQQRQIFESESSREYADDLDENMQSKSRLVEQIIALDDGFDKLFEHVKEELEGNKDKYRDDIAEMQSLIREVTRLSSKVESQEKHNRNLASKYFSGARSTIKQGRINSAAASRYYQNMMQAATITPRYMDEKE